MMIAGYDVGGMLKRNYMMRWSKSVKMRWSKREMPATTGIGMWINPEQVGQIIDINATMSLIMQAAAHTPVEFVTVPVIPSITYQLCTLLSGPADRPLGQPDGER